MMIMNKTSIIWHGKMATEMLLVLALTVLSGALFLNGLFN